MHPPLQSIYVHGPGNNTVCFNIHVGCKYCNETVKYLGFVKTRVRGRSSANSSKYDVSLNVLVSLKAQSELITRQVHQMDHIKPTTG